MKKKTVRGGLIAAYDGEQDPDVVRRQMPAMPAGQDGPARAAAPV